MITRLTKEEIEGDRYLREYFIRVEAYERGNRDGRGEGSTKTQCEILGYLIERTYRPISEATRDRLYSCTDHDIERVIDRVLSRRSLEEVFEGLYLGGVIFEEPPSICSGAIRHINTRW